MSNVTISKYRTQSVAHSHGFQRIYTVSHNCIENSCDSVAVEEVMGCSGFTSFHITGWKHQISRAMLWVGRVTRCIVAGIGCAKVSSKHSPLKHARLRRCGGSWRLAPPSPSPAPSWSRCDLARNRSERAVPIAASTPAMSRGEVAWAPFHSYFISISFSSS